MDTLDVKEQNPVIIGQVFAIKQAEMKKRLNKAPNKMRKSQSFHPLRPLAVSVVENKQENQKIEEKVSELKDIRK